MTFYLVGHDGSIKQPIDAETAADAKEAFAAEAEALGEPVDRDLLVAEVES